MSQEHSSPADAAQRIGSRDWMAPAQEKRKRWGRKRTAAVILVSAAVISTAFIISDGPRQSGLTDALGWTCGEYVHPGEHPPEASEQVWRGTGVPQEVFEDWAGFTETVTAAAAQHGDYDDAAVETFFEEVAELGQEHGAEPTYGAFGGWMHNRAQFSAVPAGDAVLVGEHLEDWTSTDRVSLVDPASGQVAISAAVEHPDREAWEDREPVLRGVGAHEGRMILQTPTVRGDTDLVILEQDPEVDPECIRLEGGFQPSRYQEDYPNAWRSVMNLSAVQNRGENELLVVHGREMDTPGSPHRISAVNLETAELEPFRADLDWAEAAESLQLGEFEGELSELGESHFFLDWDYGYIIFERQ